MKHIILILFLIILSTNISFGQNKDKFIQVTGNSKIEIQPDLGILHIRITEVRRDMEQTIQGLNETSDKFTKKIIDLGFKAEQINTSSFNVSKNKIYRKNKYIDSGYIAMQNVNIEFTYNQDIISKIIRAFSDPNLSISFSFSFNLSDELYNKVKNDLLIMAVKNGQLKAETIAQASNQIIKGVKSINHTNSNYRNGPERMQRDIAMYTESKSSYSNNNSFNLKPDNLEFTDSILIIYRIK